jgi:mono/diheme cytochrome c family protein
VRIGLSLVAVAVALTLVVAGVAVAAGNPKAGKAVWNANGCGGCHTFAAAGSKGKIGPAITKARIAADAKRAKSSVRVFIRVSIVNPNVYVAKGYKKGVMPSYGRLSTSRKQFDDLVAFIQKG